jgi:hypothetical protein
VNFILEEAGKLVALEIKAGSQGDHRWPDRESRVPRCLETQRVTRPRSGFAQRQSTSG